MLAGFSAAGASIAQELRSHKLRSYKLCEVGLKSHMGIRIKPVVPGSGFNCSGQVKLATDLVLCTPTDRAVYQFLKYLYLQAH